jgi:AcrR family transcriptional regulator
LPIDLAMAPIEATEESSRTKPANSKRAGIKSQVDSLKRQRILEEARRLFFTLGYRGTTMEAIADAVEMGKPFVYRHFRNKIGLLVELYDQAIALSEDALDRALAQGGSVDEVVGTFVRNYAQVVVNERDIVAIFFRESVNVPPEELHRIDEHKRAFDRRLADLIQTGIDEHVFDVDNARVAAYAIVGMSNWAYQWYREGGRLSPAQLGDVFAEYALRLLRGSAPAERSARRLRARSASIL